MNNEITGYELIEKIQKGEVKSGTHIKYHNKTIGFYSDLYFNGNWFSKEPYGYNAERFDDIILYLCDANVTYKIIEEDDAKIKKIDLSKDLQDILNSSDRSIVLNAIHDCLAKEEYKLNEIADYINKKESEN